MVNSSCRCWKVIEVYFDHEALISKERQLVPYARQCLCIFCLSSEALPGISHYDEISHMLHST